MGLDRSSNFDKSKQQPQPVVCACVCVCGAHQRESSSSLRSPQTIEALVYVRHVPPCRQPPVSLRQAPVGCWIGDRCSSNQFRRKGVGQIYAISCWEGLRNRSLMLRFSQHCLLSCPFAPCCLGLREEKTRSSVDQVKLRPGLGLLSTPFPGRVAHDGLARFSFVLIISHCLQYTVLVDFYAHDESCLTKWAPGGCDKASSASYAADSSAQVRNFSAAGVHKQSQCMIECCVPPYRCLHTSGLNLGNQYEAGDASRDADV